MPFYQSALNDRLEYELRFNEYSRVIQATGDANASYAIRNISIEYDLVTQQELARMIDNQYKGKVEILYDLVLRRKIIRNDKSDPAWDIDLDAPADSIKGVLMLFEDVAAQPPFSRNTEAFYNLKISKVEVTNQLSSQGMHAYLTWDEAKKFFTASSFSKRHPNAADVSLGEFLTSKYALWLDFRTTEDDWLYGNGRRIAGYEVIQITKEAEAAGP